MITLNQYHEIRNDLFNDLINKKVIKDTDKNFITIDILLYQLLNNKIKIIT